MKAFPKVQGSREEISAALAKLEERYHIIGVVVPTSEVSEAVRWSTSARCVFLVSEGAGEDAVACQNPDNAAHDLLMNVLAGWSQDSFLDALKLLVHSQANFTLSPLRGIRVFMRSVVTYHHRRGKYPQRVLEIGAGAECSGQILGACMTGSQYSCATPDPPPPEDPKVTASRVLRLLNNEVVDARSHIGELAFNSRFEEAALSGPFDLIFSHVVLEHVSDHRAILEKAHELLVQDGLFLNSVDLTGHFAYGSRQCDFLYPTEEEWRHIPLSRNLPCRLLHDDYLRLFKETGFETTYTVLGRMAIPEDLQARHPGRDLSPRHVRYYSSIAKRG